MAGYTDQLEKKVQDKVFGATDFTPPATYYAALYTTAPADDGTGMVEVSGGSYARLAVPNNVTNFAAASGTDALKTNALDWLWTAATASWGTVAGVALMDASSAGTMWAFGNLGTPKAVASGDQFKIPAGQGQFTVTG